MKHPSVLLLFTGFLAACAGDNHTTTQSPGDPVRHAQSGTTGADINRVDQTVGKYGAGRLYLVTRLQTADQPRGEWRAQGETIREHGSQIEFVEFGSGKTVAFTAPHQITPMDSHSDRQSVQPSSEGRAVPSAALYP